VTVTYFSYHIYASCSPAKMRDKLWETFVIVTSLS